MGPRAISLCSLDFPHSRCLAGIESLLKREAGKLDANWYYPAGKMGPAGIEPTISTL